LLFRSAVVVVPTILAMPAMARAQEASLRDTADVYFCREDLWNGVYVGLGATMIGVGSALVTRDDPKMSAAGWPVIAVGGIETVVGVVYLALTPGFRADADAQLAQGSRAFVDAQLERLRGVEGNFIYYKLAEGAAGLTGIGLGVAGAVTHDDTLFGVGAGLGVAAMVQITMENITHEVARRYMHALERFSVGPLGSVPGIAAQGRF
jgi:hypothetical protein